MQQPVCLEGATGLGKTSLTIVFAKLTRAGEEGDGEPYRLFSFSAETRVEMFGQLAIENGAPKPVPKELTQSMMKGLVFIADEFNLAEEDVLRTVTSALEPTRGSGVVVPAIGTPRC
jgi:MoxR-like ATPase